MKFFDYRWLCIKGKTKLYGHFTVKEVYKCKINYSITVKYIYNVTETLILFKQLDLEFKMWPPMSAAGSSEGPG